MQTTAWTWCIEERRTSKQKKKKLHFVTICVMKINSLWKLLSLILCVLAQFLWCSSQLALGVQMMWYSWILCYKKKRNESWESYTIKLAEALQNTTTTVWFSQLFYLCPFRATFSPFLLVWSHVSGICDCLLNVTMETMPSMSFRINLCDFFYTMCKNP